MSDEEEKGLSAEQTGQTKKVEIGSERTLIEFESPSGDKGLRMEITPDLDVACVEDRGILRVGFSERSGVGGEMHTITGSEFTLVGVSLGKAQALEMIGALVEIGARPKEIARFIREAHYAPKGKHGRRNEK